MQITLDNVFEVHLGRAVQRGIFSIPGRYHKYCGGYHEYNGGCSVHWEDIMNTLGNIMINMGEVYFKNNWNLYGNPIVLNPIILQCTEHPPVYCTNSVYSADIMQGEIAHKICERDLSFL